MNTLEQKPTINTLVVIGLGLIGGSLAAAVKSVGGCNRVIAVVRRRESADFALQQGIIDQFCFSIGEIASELSADDVIFVAVPPLAVKQVLSVIKVNVPDFVTITDGVSVKGRVVADIAEVYGSVPSQFVPGHPIAGSEKNGVIAADSSLYKNHRVILTPLSATGETHRKRVEVMWQIVGAEVLTMPVEEHDEVLAATSHLPHAIAYSLVDTLSKDVNNENIFRYAAGGFRDFTRIASSDPTMWHDIMLTNRESIVKCIELFQCNLDKMRQAIENNDSDYLLKAFTRAKIARDLFSKAISKK